MDQLLLSAGRSLSGGTLRRPPTTPRSVHICPSTYDNVLSSIVGLELAASSLPLLVHLLLFGPSHGRLLRVATTHPVERVLAVSGTPVCVFKF